MLSDDDWTRRTNPTSPWLAKGGTRFAANHDRRSHAVDVASEKREYVLVTAAQRLL